MYLLVPLFNFLTKLAIYSFETSLKLQIVLAFYYSFDGSRPTDIQKDFPDMKSQLDLTSFGVGVPAVGGNIMPQLWKHVE